MASRLEKNIKKFADSTRLYRAQKWQEWLDTKTPSDFFTEEELKNKTFKELRELFDSLRTLDSKDRTQYKEWLDYLAKTSEFFKGTMFQLPGAVAVSNANAAVSVKVRPRQLHKNTDTQPNMLIPQNVIIYEGNGGEEQILSSPPPTSFSVSSPPIPIFANSKVKKPYFTPESNFSTPNSNSSGVDSNDSEQNGEEMVSAGSTPHTTFLSA